MSKETTYRELCAFKDIDFFTQQMAGINLTASHVNAVEIATSLFKAPPLDNLLEAFEADIAAGNV